MLNTGKWANKSKEIYGKHSFLLCNFTFIQIEITMQSSNLSLNTLLLAGRYFTALWNEEITSIWVRYAIVYVLFICAIFQNKKSNVYLSRRIWLKRIRSFIAYEILEVLHRRYQISVLFSMMETFNKIYAPNIIIFHRWYY